MSRPLNDRFWYRLPKHWVPASEPYEHLVVTLALQPRRHAELIAYSDRRALMVHSRTDDVSKYVASLLEIAA